MENKKRRHTDTEQDHAGKLSVGTLDTEAATLELCLWVAAWWK